MEACDIANLTLEPWGARLILRNADQQCYSTWSVEDAKVAVAYLQAWIAEQEASA